MVISLKVENFRSIKDEILFSLEADSGQSNPDNIAEIELVNDSSLRLFKTAVIYGSNASGKTNLIRAFHTLVQFILTSADNKAEDTIRFYDPFLFDSSARDKPCKLEFIFAIPDETTSKFTKYKYELVFTKNEILVEELDYYPKSKPHNLFKRESKDKMLDTGRLGKNLNYKEYDLFKNQLLLSTFGKQNPHELLSKVYLYFTTYEVWNVLDTFKLEGLKERVLQDLLSIGNEKLVKQINRLLKVADIKIEGIKTKETTESDFSFAKDFSKELKRRILEINRNQVVAEHFVYSNEQKVDSHFLPLREESSGTNVLFALGGMILKKLDSGGAIIFDELNNSLHPKLSKFLVRLFNHPITNPKNTQLIFATHEVTLLDNEVFRKDQIWITDKDKYGNTDLYCIKENCNVRDDMPFDKWYMTGKLGGQPKIKEVEFIFGDE